MSHKLGGFGLIAAAALLSSVSAQAAPLNWTPLTLGAQWSIYPFEGVRVPAGAIDPNNNMVHLRGAIRVESGGAATRAFRLPPALRPGGTVYIPVDTCEATYGRLVILRNGNVNVQGNADAIECFVSLEGVSFSKDGIGQEEPPVSADTPEQ